MKYWESVSLCLCPTDIHYKYNFNCPLLGQKMNVGFLNKHNKNQSCSNPHLAATRQRDLFSISTEFVSISSHQTPHFWRDCSALPIEGMTETKEAWWRCLKHVLRRPLCSSEYQTIIQTQLLLNRPPIQHCVYLSVIGWN